jgi:hypothetical protein
MSDPSTNTSVWKQGVSVWLLNSTSFKTSEALHLLYIAHKQGTLYSPWPIHLVTWPVATLLLSPLLGPFLLQAPAACRGRQARKIPIPILPDFP